MTVMCQSCDAQARTTLVALRRRWCRHTWIDRPRQVAWSCPSCTDAAYTRALARTHQKSALAQQRGGTGRYH